MLALAIGGEGYMLTMSQASRFGRWCILNERREFHRPFFHT